MKKFIYIILLTVISGLSFTSCTEEVIAPKLDANSPQGGSGQLDK